MMERIGAPTDLEMQMRARGCASRADLAEVGLRVKEARPGSGWFVEPTIFADVSPDSRLAREEIFGPVLSVMRARDLDEAIALANNARFGLSASIFTRDLNSVQEYCGRIEAGVVKVNSETAGIEPQVPFGGMKESSSHSREQGRAAMDFFTSIKTVYVDRA